MAGEQTLGTAGKCAAIAALAALWCAAPHARAAPQATAGSTVQAAISSDPPRDAQHPATMAALTIPSHGSRMNAVLYLAAGAERHPAVLLLHGFPGNEQNLDLAQAMRRAGWSVLTFHYRGAWGSPGAFSFSHAIEDTDAALAFLRDGANAAKYRIDPRRIVVVGHSMGGFLALHLADTHPALAGVAVISAWNIGEQTGHATTAEEKQKIEASWSDELAPLAGCTAESLLLDAKSHASAWNFVNYAQAIHRMPALVIEADDGLRATNAAMAEALRTAGDARVTERSMATDHSYSDHRIALETAVLRWLASLPGHAQPA